MSVAVLVTSDGHVFSGRAFGAIGEVVAPALIDTSVADYSRVLSMGESEGKIAVFASPHIGNVGLPAPFEPLARGVVVREASRIASNWQSQGELEPALRAAGVAGIEGIDTRALVKLLVQNPDLRVGIFSGAVIDSYDLEEGERTPRDLVKCLQNRVKGAN
ncbi:carbamoyl-phosphate synthase domain-containing protein [Gleimia europaea]|uniref:Carbamoyl-phosphate synthase small subunit N-terminal domain-containing protein n=1 Tax=Gleimia europaea ACS-120-V-Col10b TaxID=883069 RepID=A0A9W5RDM4_9ACTO|nr:carbamoyl-phosphate synthase domain-containing protein [Gleimia europaea]EPD30460.1 hypothetical protein HMPREF9238_00203 [Gleimia europaea ACS-120-V-Col10b]